jgi:hypothetical protein
MKHCRVDALLDQVRHRVAFVEVSPNDRAVLRFCTFGLIAGWSQADKMLKDCLIST